MKIDGPEKCDFPLTGDTDDVRLKCAEIVTCIFIVPAQLLFIFPISFSNYKNIRRLQKVRNLHCTQTQKYLFSI